MSTSKNTNLQKNTSAFRENTSILQTVRCLRHIPFDRLASYGSSFTKSTAGLRKMYGKNMTGLLLKICQLQHGLRIDAAAGYQILDFDVFVSLVHRILTPRKYRSESYRIRQTLCVGTAAHVYR